MELYKHCPLMYLIIFRKLFFILRTMSGYQYSTIFYYYFLMIFSRHHPNATYIILYTILVENYQNMVINQITYSYLVGISVEDPCKHQLRTLL